VLREFQDVARAKGARTHAAGPDVEEHVVRLEVAVHDTSRRRIVTPRRAAA
jgi:hypothetical protein